MAPCRKTRAWRLGQRVALGLAGTLALALAVGGARTALSFGADELAEAVPAARAIAGPDDVLVARKPHLAYYTGARFALLPDLQNAAGLRAWLCTLRPKGRVLVYDGQIERAFRPALQPVLAARSPPAWLERVAAGPAGGGWALYLRRDPACLASPPGAPDRAGPSLAGGR